MNRKTKPVKPKAKAADKVAKLLAFQLGVDEDEVTPAADLRNDLGADSLDLVEISMAIEEEFGLPEIDMDTVDGWKTVQDVRNYLDRQPAAAGK